MLPYFSWLGIVAARFLSASLKVLSRVIYVGGPCKAHYLLRLATYEYTLSLGFCLFIVAVHFWITSWSINGTCVITLKLTINCFRSEVFTAHSNLLLVTVSVQERECPSLASSALSKPNTPLCTEMILLVEI
jgi:hypothetical protein